MRAVDFALALGAIGILTLTGCSTVATQPSDSPTVVASAAQQPVRSGFVAAPEKVGDPGADASAEGSDAPAGVVPSCTAASLTPTLGDIPQSDTQITVPLTYTNTGTLACNVTGYPGATLVGPDVAGLGPHYDLARSETTPSSTIRLDPGGSAVADVTLGSVNKNDSRAWLATALLTTAPGDTTVMTVPIPTGAPVLRQDAATRPASFIGAFTGP